MATSGHEPSEGGGAGKARRPDSEALRMAEDIAKIAVLLVGLFLRWRKGRP
jgi:hypothetical protein